MHMNKAVVAAAVLAATCTVAGASAGDPRATGIRATYLASSHAARNSDLRVRPSDLRDVVDGWTHAMAHADFNGDGRTDVALAALTYRDDGFQDERRPVEIWLNTGDGFVDASADILLGNSPGLVHPRKALVGDYNDDGWPDLAMLGHGHDAPPFAGEYNQLFLSNGDGTLRYDDQLVQWPGFHHSGASADVDNDGTIDIVTVAGSIAVLRNDGAGNFTRTELDIVGGYYTGELADVDADGHVDLLLGGHEHEDGPTEIYWGDGTGDFGAHARTVLPRKTAYSIAVDFAVGDLTGDARPDVVVSRTGSDPFYEGRWVQVLAQTEPRKFVDETHRRFPNEPDNIWLDRIRLQDLDADGAPDLFIHVLTGPLPEIPSWRNNGRGTFYAHAGGGVPQVTHWRSWPGDFDGDGRDDILWRNTVTGESMGWPGGDGSLQTPFPPLSMDWQVAGIADFDGDGAGDLLARNRMTGENSAWSAIEEAAMPVVGTLSDLDWDAAGVGDFDGDGRADILWRHAFSGANMVWPAGDAGGSEPLPKVDIAWVVAGIGDFDGDGQSDVLWRNQTTGANQIWHSASAGDRRTVGTVKDAWWRIMHIADFDDDGVDDILWRHARRGINRYWRGAYAREVQPFARVANPMQELAGVGDYDGDGRPDLMWRHLETGALQVWLKGNPKARMKVAAPEDIAWRPVS